MSNNTEYLIDQLDKSLQGEMSSEFRERLQEEEELAKEWQDLQIALEAIREAGLTDQVVSARKTYLAVSSAETAKAPAKLRPMFRNLLRVAAVFILLLGATAIYKYAAVNGPEMFDRYYNSFNLSTSRGAANADPLEKAYRQKQWEEVLSRFSTLETKTNKSYFLTGMANLELKKPAAAIPMFKQILENNQTQGDQYFQDEAEYYLALAYLANKEGDLALPILKKIRSEKGHLYHDLVNQISDIDLKIISYKSGK